MHDAETRLVAVTRHPGDTFSSGEGEGLTDRIREAWENGITEADAAHLDHALHPDRCSDCEGLSRKLRHAFGHIGSERWPWS